MSLPPLFGVETGRSFVRGDERSQPPIREGIEQSAAKDNRTGIASAAETSPTKSSVRALS